MTARWGWSGDIGVLQGDERIVACREVMNRSTREYP